MIKSHKSAITLIALLLITFVISSKTFSKLLVLERIEQSFKYNSLKSNASEKFAKIPTYNQLKSNSVTKFAGDDSAAPNSDSVSTSVAASAWTSTSASVSNTIPYNHSTCSAEDKGFGMKGWCMSNAYSHYIIGPSSLPSEVKSSLTFVYDAMFKILMPFDACFGDFTGKELQNDSNLKHHKCNTIPLMEDYTYGTLGFFVEDVPCGPKPVKLAGCAVFDRCGTVGIALNGGILQCAATVSTGVAALLSPVADILKSFSFGFSLKRRFTKTFKIAYGNGESVVSKSITTYGHIFMALGFGSPLEIFKFDNKRLKDIFSFSSTSTFMIDLGDVQDTLEATINSIKNVQNFSEESSKEFLQTLLNTGAEITVTVKGNFVIKLNDLTRGFLNNFEFELASFNLLISMGGRGNLSGMGSGVYIYFSVGVLNNLQMIFDKVWDNFAGILSKFGISKPTLPNMDVTLGMFITSESAGFEFGIFGAKITCIFVYSSKSGSCDFNSRIFTAILEATKWVIKEAKKLFDNTGREIIKFGNDVGRFAENSANVISDFATKDVKNFFEKDVSNFFVKDFSDFFSNDVKNFFSNDVKNVITNDIGNFVKNDVGNFVKNDVGNFVKNDVGNFVKNDVRNFFSSIFG